MQSWQTIRQLLFRYIFQVVSNKIILFNFISFIFSDFLCLIEIYIIVCLFRWWSCLIQALQVRFVSYILMTYSFQVSKSNQISKWQPCKDFQTLLFPKVSQSNVNLSFWCKFFWSIKSFLRLKNFFAWKILFKKKNWL